MVKPTPGPNVDGERPGKLMTNSVVAPDTRKICTSNLGTSRSWAAGKSPSKPGRRRQHVQRPVIKTWGGGGRDLDRPIRAYGRATENEPLHLFANPPQTCLRAFSWPRARRPGNKRWQCELAVELLDYQVRARIFSPNIKPGSRYAPFAHTHLENMSDQDEEPLMLEVPEQSVLGKVLTENRQIKNRCHKHKN